VAAVDLLSSLNPVQQQAVLHGEGPLLILAGAGSGKTRTLTHRVAHLIGPRGVSAGAILAVTFTNKAAAEMRERLQHLLGAGSLPWVSTFHATCARILRRDIAGLGFTSGFTIYDDRDSERLLTDVLAELHIPEAILPSRLAAALIDGAKNRGEAAEDYARRDGQRAELTAVYRRYQERLRRANALDFGDLLLTTVRLFAERPPVLDRYRQQWQHILVDEFQDTNGVQYQLTNALAAQHRQLCVVGDDDQSIYRWRGAEIANILDFERDYPDATIIRLEQNYRSTGNILAAASAVVARNARRKGKTLWTENARGDLVAVAELADDLEEGRFVACEIERVLAGPWARRDIAVLYRTNAQSRAVEEALTHRGIPYALLGGVKFFARAEVKDALAYVRLLVNPADALAAARVINLPPRGVGSATLERLSGLAEEAGGLLAACRLAVDRGLLKPQVSERLRAFLAILDDAAQGLTERPYPQVAARLIQDSGYAAMLREAGEDGCERLQNLDELLKGMEEAAAMGRSLHEFLEQAALVSEVDAYESDADRVTLMTLHAAKGLEFPVVFMIGLEEGLFPHARVGDADIEEERRLCYVGMTRAMRRLILTHARRRRVYGDAQMNLRSRFVDEIPGELIEVVASAPRSTPTAWRASTRQPPFARPRQQSIQVASGEDGEGVRIVYEEDGLRVGARVRHGLFGVGTVKRLEGVGEGQKVTVLFPSVGAKKLLLHIAGLEPA
jgi:DNA helicase-2/ATP-dependent DNA helicase PcrA